MPQDTKCSPPSYANPQGDFQLDEVLARIYRHWRDGRQIVLLVGAGISVQSGYPAVNALGEHLLILHAMKQQALQFGNAHEIKIPAYSLERDGWVSLSRLPEFYSQNVEKRETPSYQTLINFSFR